MGIKINSRTIVALFIVAFLVRLSFVFFYNPGLTFPDENRFVSEGKNLIYNGTLEADRGDRAHDMPMTALVLAGIFLLADVASLPPIITAKVFFSLISSLTVLLIGRLAVRFYPTKVTYIVAALIACFYPFFIFYSTILISETIFLFFVALFFVYYGRPGPTLKNGLAAGLAHLTRPTLLYFLPMAWIYQHYRFNISRKKIMYSVLIFCLVVSPWVVRNYVVFNAFVPTHANTGHVLYAGNNPYNKEGGVLDQQPPGNYHKLNELKRDNREKELAIRFIKNNPVRQFVIGLNKIKRFWNIAPNAKQWSSGVYWWGSVLSFGPILFLSIIGIYFLRKKWRLISISALFIIYYTAVHAITIGSIRYRLPVEVLLVAFASATLVKLYNDFIKA